VAHYNLGKALGMLGRSGEAIAEYREALRSNPNYADAHNNLGIALVRQGNMGEGITQLKKALELEPSSLSHENNLAWMLATAPQTTLRDGAKALQLALQASQSTGGANPTILRTLAAAYAQAGKYPDAVRTAQSALQIAESGGLADKLRGDVKFYEAGHSLPDGQ
jgi:tetratricopeptide (TPR) repeat protein